jgi:hypothetical protein
MWPLDNDIVSVKLSAGCFLSVEGQLKNELLEGLYLEITATGGKCQIYPSDISASLVLAQLQ